MAKYLKKLLSVWIVLFFVTNANAGSVGGFGGALEITQIANNVQLMQTYAQEIIQVQHMVTQIANQLSMYQNMITNTQDLVTGPFQSAMQTIMQLKTTIDQATQLSYSVGSVDTYFQQLNPNYATLFQGNNYDQLQQNWRSTLLDYCEGALKAANMSITNVQSDTQLLQQLTNASNNAVGQKSAIQAANNIALEMVAKMGELKMLTASQVQSQTIYLTQKKVKEEADQRAVQDLYRYNPNVTNPGDNVAF